MMLCAIILASLCVSLISFVGIIFFVTKLNLTKATFYLVSLASGAMLGTALFHLIPESLEINGRATFGSMAGGLFFFFILEKFLIWRHCHTHQHSVDHSRATAANMVLVGDGIHNFIDGVIIASSFLASMSVGVSVTIAIVLHEIPQELGDFGTLIHGGYSVRKALLLNAVTATTSMVGAVLAYFFLEAAPVVQSVLLPVAAGGFLYIALADLIPQLHEQTTLRHTLGQIALLAAGFAATVVFKPHH